jgi:hypothetical protein
MASGIKRIVYNTRERVISNDLNREQAFQAADIAETLRYVQNTAYVSDYSCAGYETVSPVVGQLVGDVIGGLLVKPGTASIYLTISAGKLSCFNPAASPSTDDSDYKIISSQGVTALAPLAITPSTGGGVRIDVIECSPYENAEEQDNRDVFSAFTGSFTANLVDKVVADRLTFRIRTGTDGAGFPGVASGWLPLAVMSVPNGATTCDQITFWDVRPLISDRVESPFRVANVVQKQTRNLSFIDVATPGQFRVAGIVDTTHGEYKAGGALFKGTPSATMGTGDVDYVDLSNAENQEPGFAPINSRPWYLYALFPFSLPRWVRYTENAVGSLGRIPRACKGIPVLTTKGCNYTSIASTGISPPTITGLGSSTSDAVVIVAGITSSAGALQTFISDGHMLTMNYSNCPAITPTSSTLTDDLYTLIPNTHFPLCARRLRLFIYCSIDGVAATEFTYRRVVVIRQFATTNNLATFASSTANGIIPTIGSSPELMEVVVPLPPRYPLLTPNNQVIFVDYTGTGYTGRTSISMRVVGWDLGP